MKFISLCCLAVFAALPLRAALTDGGGRPFREIVIAADAPDSVRLAAAELARFLVETGQQELPVVTAPGAEAPVIYVGDHPDLRRHGVDPTALGSDGYIIRSLPGALAIAGKDYAGKPLFGERNPWRDAELYNYELKLSALMDQGTLFGVYAFLEEFAGVRFYLPLDLGTVADPIATIVADGIDIERTPRFNYRYPWYSFLKNDPDGALWMHRAGFGGKAPVMIIHSYDRMLPYKESHPEYFALIDGKRAFGSECVADGKGHLCLNNPGLIQRWIDEITAFFDANPEFEVYPLAPNDGLVRICECPECQADLVPGASEQGKFSYHIWKFTDRVARGVAERHPDKYVGCIAYSNYREPPAGLELSPNAAVMFCYNRGAMVNRRHREAVHAEVDAWSRMAGRMYYWVWYLDHWAPTDYLPILYSEAIADEVRRMADNPKFAGEFIESENRAERFPFGHDRMGIPGMQHLNLYLTGKLYWNPQADVKAILDEYFRRFYGPAEAPMRRFWLAAEARRNAALADELDVAPDRLFPPEFIAELSASLAEALELTDAGSLFRARVELIAGEFEIAAGRMRRLLQQGPSIAEVPRLAEYAAIAQTRPARFMTVSAEAAEPVTRIYFGYDRRNLYLRILCFEPEMANLTSPPRDPDQFGIWNDDCVEIFLSPDAERPEECRQLIVNAAGARWDAAIASLNQPDLAWDSQAQIQVKHEPNRWSVDVAIPFAALGIADPDFTGDLAADIYRHRPGGERPERSMWSPTGRDENYTPAHFGRLRLRK